MGTTVFKGGLQADDIHANGGISALEVIGAGLVGGLYRGHSISKAVDYTLSAAEIAAPYICVELTAASKAVTLGIGEGQLMIVANVGGTNAFTLKGRSGDSGTSLAAGKVAIVFGSKTANATKIYVLN